MEAIDRSAAPQPTRYLRREAAAGAAAAAAAAAGPGAPPPPAPAAVLAAVGADVWDLLTPEDVLGKLAKKEPNKQLFYDGVASEKWKGATINPGRWRRRPQLSPLSGFLCFTPSPLQSGTRRGRG